MMNKELKARQIALFFIAFLPVIKLFNMPKAATDAANEDMWISILISLTLDFLTVLALVFVDKKMNADVYTVLEANFGKTVAKVVLSIYLLYFLLKAFPPVFEQENFVRKTLYETSPTAFSFIPFLFLTIYICCAKLRAIGRLADITWIFSVSGIVLLIVLSFENADFLSILPIGANGLKVVRGTGYITPWFTDATYFMFMIGCFNKEKHSTLKIIVGFIVHAVLTLAFAVVFYSVFTFVANRELFALAEVSKYSTVINSIGRFDYIGIFAILIPNTVSIALPTSFATQIFKKIFNAKKPWIPATLLNAVEMIPVLFFRSYNSAIIGFIALTASPVMLILGNFLPVCLLFLKKPQEAEEKRRLKLR
ncbi:MAG: GerAB/ArcD/ProY family transporter [Clostridia bacterium]|nr:GerAB/ArcD/ProY family transporter [Clostridia bacterium]